MKRNNRNLRIVSWLGLIAVFMCVALPAHADPIPLTYDDNLKDIQQTMNNPCVIGSPSCNNALPYTTVPGGPGDWSLDSPVYTVQQLIDVTGSNVLNLLIDVNQSCGDAVGCPVQVDLIEVYIDGAVVYNFVGPQDSPLAGSLQGNGYSDAGWYLIDLSSYGPDVEVYFHIEESEQTDGQESYFLSAGTPVQVPEPTSLVLLGIGLAGFGVWRRKSR